MIHPSADVQSTKIGENTSIWQFAVVLKNAEIGSDCNINCHTFIENNVTIGNNVTIKSGVYLWDGITLEDDVFVGPNATFVNNPHVRSKQYPEKHIGAHLCRGVSVGANATIMGNITLKEYAFVGAGSVVTKDIPPFQLWYGNPAVHKGYVTKNGTVLDLDLYCKAEEKKYKIVDTEPLPL